MQAEDSRTILDEPALRDLVDGVSDLVQSIHPDGRIRFVNAAWCRRLGYTRDEALALNIFQVIHPDSQEHCMHYLQRLVGGEDVGTMEVTFVTKAGEPVFLEGSVTVRFEGGVPIATRGIFREAPRQRRGEASMSRLREQRRLFHSVLSILRANTSRDRQEFLALVTRKAAQALHVARASIWLFDERHQQATCEQLHADGTDLGRTGQRILRADHPAYFESIESQLPVRADDAHTHLATHSLTESYLRPLGIQSMLDTPIRLGEHIAGVLCCEHIGPARRWTNDEEEFTLAIAAIVLIFLENERRIAAEDKLQRLNAQLEAMVAERTAELARSERRLRYVLTSGPSVIFTFDPAGDCRSTYVSPNTREVLGYPAEDFLSDERFWSDRIHPDDAPEAHARMRQAMSTGTSVYEYRFRLPDGTYRWMRDELMLMRDASGTPLEIVGSCIEIDDRRRAEDAARAAAMDVRRLIETANAPIFGKDTQNRINEWNHCAERLTGYAKSDVMGRSLSDFIVPEYREAVRAVLDRALAGHETANFEFPMIAKDGRPLLLLLSASSRRDASGAIIGMVGVGQDITEHRESERRSLRAQRLESIGTLAGGVAHDVNNALTPILLATGLFRRRHPESHDLIDIMESSARRGASMVQQLLTFAKGVDGRRAAVESAPLLRELEAIVASTFPKSISARFHCGEGLPPVLGDSTQLHQVLLNLCVNARDAMPRGGQLVVEAMRTTISSVEARAHGDGGAGEFILWRVSDSGLGIAQDLLDRIFEPFFSTKSPEQGTGLGLSTAMGIVRSHGGFMRVHSRPNEGSTFSVYLPAARPEATDAPPPPPEPRFRGRGETVLVVDDEPAVRDVCRQILLALGLRVRVATDGASALEVLGDPSVDIAAVITDLHMPRMDGIELTRAIRKRWPSLGVILSSGRVDRADAGVLEALGISAQLDKPFTLSSLSAALAATLPATTPDATTYEAATYEATTRSAARGPTPAPKPR